MWEHTLSLLRRSWDLFIGSLGSTSLGFLAPYVVPLIGFLLTVVIAFKRQGTKGVRDHIGKTLSSAVSVGLAGGLIVYGSILGWNVIRMVYSDHQNLVSDNTTLRSDLQSANDELAKNSKELSELRSAVKSHSPVVVGRRLPEGDKPFMRRILARDDHKKIIICVPKVDTLNDQSERQAYSDDFVDLFKSSGWDVQRWKDANIQQGLRGILFAASADNPPGSWPDFGQLAKALDEAKIRYGRAAIPFAALPAGISTSELVVCIGSK